MEKAEMILDMFKKDSEKAFQLLYDTYFEVLVLFAAQLTGNPDAAGDIVQECFVKFWLNKPFKTLSSGLDKYIFQAVKFSSVNYLRSDRRKRNLYENAGLETESFHEEMPEVQYVDVLEVVYRAINTLPEERRRVFLMVFVDNLSYQEVADRLQISKNTVKTQLSRSLNYLRNALKPNYSSYLLFFLLKK